MRVLLSTIGSRGDVQPLTALALELRALGHDAHLCVPPDFRDLVEGLGLSLTPIGPDVRAASAARAPANATPPAPPSPEQRRAAIQAMVDNQFETVSAAAERCDIILGATALQIATRSVAEVKGIPYVFAAYCPAVLPSAHHAPPPLISLGQSPAPEGTDPRELWARNAERFNASFGDALNKRRAAAGLGPVGDVRSHVFTDHPWLAVDPTLWPWPDPQDASVFQTGAWILRDERPLSPELEAFVDAGEAPVYFGFGSMHAPADLGQAMLRTARSLGRRAILSRGWADLSLVADKPDCLVIGEVNQQALFPRVAAAVHHGGAGTTTAAALAGAPQLVAPQLYDQHYWAQRVADLGVGAAHAPGVPTAESLGSALERVLLPDVAARAHAVSHQMRSDGARVAAERLIAGGL